MEDIEDWRWGKTGGKSVFLFECEGACVRHTESKARSYPPAGVRPFFETQAPAASETSS